MNIVNLKDSWGSVITATVDEVLQQEPDFWRNLIYERKFLLFKTMAFTEETLALMTLQFGSPWRAADYQYSREGAKLVKTEKGTLILSEFSNKSRVLKSNSMAWHSDIPNRFEKPFPFRGLWITKNPYPLVSGKTGWLNLEKALDYLTPEMLDLAQRTTVVQQSWYQPGTDIQEFPLIKTQPVTGVKSLRLNFFNDLKNKVSNAWIKGVKIDGVLQPDCSLIDDFLKFLEKIDDLVYIHTWDTYDFAIYDNWSFVHNRTVIVPLEVGERHFYRVNIDHCSEEEWSIHKSKYNLV